MDLGSALRILLRRWLVVLTGALLTVGVAGYFYMTAEARYQASARMLLLLPADARGPDAIGSPFLYLPNGLNVIARMVSGAPQGREFRTQMTELGLTSSVQVGVDPQTPIISVSVEGTDPDNVIATRDWLVEALNDELLKVQEEEGAPRNQIAHTRVYAAEDVPLTLGGDWQRSVLGAAAAGALLTLIAAFAIDRLIITRRARKVRKEQGVQPNRAAEPADGDADDVHETTGSEDPANVPSSSNTT